MCPQVGDLGLAKRIGALSPLAGGSYEMPTNRRPYVAPEELSKLGEGQNGSGTPSWAGASKAGDIYSYGVLLVSGWDPFVMSSV